MVDAAGTLHTSVAELKKQLSESEQKMANYSSVYTEERLAPIKKQLAEREASLAATLATAAHVDPEGAAAAQLAGLSTKEVEGLPISALAPEYVEAGDPGKPTVQRVIGALVIAIEAGDASAATAAKLAAAVEVYYGKRSAAAAEVVPKILEDVERYAAVVSELMQAPGAAEALGKLERLAAQVEPGAEAEAAALVVGDPEAPAPTEPGHAFFLRRRGGAACAFLYSLVCAVVSGGGDGAALVIPGGIKAVPRMVFKTMVNYAGDFSRCKDVVRVTIQVGSLVAVASTVELLFGVEGLMIIRIKDRFQPGYDSAPIGGYRDVQLLCVFKVAGRWQYGEIQINVDLLVEIKSREGGGHTIFKFARSFEGYSAATYTFSGKLSAAVCEGVKAGLLIDVDLQGDKQATPALRAELWAALESPKCRVASLK